MPEVKYTYKQGQFLELVKSGRNLFLTGKAGTGKSFIVKSAIEALKDAGKNVAAVAPTGIAANNIDGQTIHSLFKLLPYGVLSFDTCQFVSSDKKILLRKIDTYVIDEVSMLRPDVLDAIHLTLKKNGLAGLDTKQLILVGDLKQLPPILEDNTRSVLYQTYDGDTFLFAKIYEKLNMEMVELDEILRQSDPDFISALNIVREGGKSEYFRQFVSREPLGIILAPHNSTVKSYNEAGLNAQQGKLFTFDADIEGEAKPEDFHLEREIRVKNGCKIMYLVNSKENPLRNGTLGTFVSHNGCHFIRVGNVDYALDRVKLVKKQYVWNKRLDKLELKELGSIEQYPFKLAYALSIHKAQGLTFDQMTIDLSRPCFQKGQMYVALSRARSPEGLRIFI
jgi:ATP-dependent DNA helicase PIF1